MPPTWNKVVALASVRLYGPAEGFPVVTDHGWKQYSVAEQEWPAGLSTFQDGVPALEFLPGVGLVNRPFVVINDTRIGFYNTAGGTWEERRPASGSPRKYRVEQISAAANLAWSATSMFPLPANPHFAFTLGLFDNPADNDAVTFPPYARFEFGGDPAQWALDFSNAYGARVLRRVDGAWQQVAGLAMPRGASAAEPDAEELLAVVRCYRGKLLVSLGEAYAIVANPDGSPIAIPNAYFTVRGQGGMVRFGVHQVRYYAGTFTAALRNTFTARPAATPTITARGLAPGASSITLADNSNPAAARAGWTATLTPATYGTLPFPFYYGPELYTVRYSLPVITDGGEGGYTEPWADRILAIDINEPVDLAGAKATIYVLKDPAVQFTGDYKWRRVDIALGWLKDDGSQEWHDPVFTGHISRIGAEQRVFGQAVIPVELENVTVRARTTEWSELNCEPLGGLTVNAALDTCLAVLGLGAGFRDWHPSGAIVLMPEGAPEDPFFYPQPGDNVWDVMKDVAAVGGLEIGATVDGKFATVPIGYVSGTVDHTWDAAPTDDAERTVEEAAYTFESANNATCVIARGKDEFGNLLLAFGVDSPAELNTASGRFSEWRMTHREDVKGTTTIGMLVDIVQGHMLASVPPRYDLEIRSPVRLDVHRRDRIEVHGTTVGAADTDQFKVLTRTIRFSNEAGGARLSMVAGCQRVAPLP